MNKALIVFGVIFILSFGCIQTETVEEPEAPEKIEEVPEEPTTDANGWGTECENKLDCGHFDELVDCVMGHCKEVECIFISDCPEGTEFCYEGKCTTEAELHETLESCCANKMDDECLCHGTCENCDDGEYSCIVTSSSSGEESYSTFICVECATGSPCKEGFACVEHKCVRGPE
jgi:hypothetical protein